MHRHFVALPLALALAAGCRTSDPARVAGSPPAPAPAPAATTAPVSSSRGTVPVESWPCPKVPDSVHWSRNSAEHRAALLQAYRLAAAQLDQAVGTRKPGQWAVILDADETVIDNSLYQRERAVLGLAYNRESWTEWCERRVAPPLPGAVAFLQKVHAMGGLIAIVTNRREAVCPATADDFKKYGIPYDAMLCKPETASDEKEPRFDAVKSGAAIAGHGPLEVVMWVGDNIQDFPEQGQELRTAAESALDAFGSRFIVIPNPMYGSWVDNPRE
jgi:5'-nucleotidase (lipoprotein e(P4) family)